MQTATAQHARMMPAIGRISAGIGMLIREEFFFFLSASTLILLNSCSQLFFGGTVWERVCMCVRSGVCVCVCVCARAPGRQNGCD